MTKGVRTGGAQHRLPVPMEVGARAGGARRPLALPVSRGRKYTVRTACRFANIPVTDCTV